jgi:ATP-binding protein involved in chromosome partitioning
MWGELDALVVDLPPGTGDPSITIAQAIPDAEILMVTTPQKVALADVKRAISMFRKMGKEVLGIVENMSYFSCEHSDDKIEIFGEGGGAQLSRETGIPLLAKLPIDISLRVAGDEGVPLMAAQPDSPTGELFKRIADELSASVTATV